MTQVEVVAGRPALVRTGGDEVRHEADVLAAIAGPGVPEVLERRDTGAGVRLVTSLAPPLPRHGLDGRAVAHQLAVVLARAHDAGLVHGTLLDEHLLGTPDAVVLGGWEGAGPGDPADDVAELGRLLTRLAADDPSLDAVANRATAPDRPTMVALAASLAPTPVAEDRPRPLPGRRLVTGFAAAAVVVAAGVVLAAGRQPQSAATTIAVTTTTVRPPATTTTSTVTATTVAPSVRGNEIEIGGQRWRVGQPGDVVVVGDLGCDGVPVPVVLRPGTGQLWVFEGWAEAGKPVSGRPLATVPGAVDLRVEAGDGCDQLVVVDAAGRTATVG